MKNYSQSVKNAYKQRRSFIVIGLTGRTGSGCTTVSNILSKREFDSLDLHNPKTFDFSSRDERKYEVIYNFMNVPNRWVPFSIIEGSSIIFSFILEDGLESFKNYIKQYKNVNDSNNIRISAYSDLEKTVDGMEFMFEDSDLCNLSDLNGILSDPKRLQEYYDFYLFKLPKLKQSFYKAISDFTCYQEQTDRFSQTIDVKSHFYTFIMQQIGNNIRSSGSPYSNEYTENNFYDVAERIDSVIAIIKKYNDLNQIRDTRICIDAIRNPYESYYFKDKYSSFYLISINSEEIDIKRRLNKLDADEQKSLDEIEYLQNSQNNYDLFCHQNMPDCLSISDIHIYNQQTNDGKYYFLTEQLLKYISLMLHPGLVNPTHIERCMQTAYVARLNSGCLSRQVGAAITDEYYSIKAIGWNEVPEGQVPCNLRSVSDYCINKDKESYSTFELENYNFQNALLNINKLISICDLDGMSFSYCFKDIYNGNKNPNQVMTRALHAEENSFLQLSKYGGQGIKGGKLFSTASPCELCSKKAYQLGIKDIYYIDPYPGISVNHILSFGTKHNPAMHLFYGAIGSAYMSLYTPRLAIKDELKLQTGINCKKVVEKSNSKPNQTPQSLSDIRYAYIKNSFIFKSRTNILEFEEADVEALHDGIDNYSQDIYWTGSSFDGFKIQYCDRGYNVNTTDNQLPYNCTLKFNKPLLKSEHVKFKIEMAAKDTQHIMYPYYAQMVSVKIDHLIIEMQAPDGILDNVTSVVYADVNMSKELEIDRQPIKNVKDDNGVKTYTFEIEHPNIMYSYCLEWKFK